MRRYVLIVGGLEALIWLGVTPGADSRPQRIDINGLHFFFIACTVPGLTLGIFNRAPRTATALVSTAAFVMLNVAVASRIAG